MTIQNVEVLLILDPLPALLVLTFNLLPVPALSTSHHQLLPKRTGNGDDRKEIFVSNKKMKRL